MITFLAIYAIIGAITALTVGEELSLIEIITSIIIWPAIVFYIIIKLLEREP